MRLKDVIGRAANSASSWAGSTTAIVLMAISMAVYFLGGLYYGFSDTYQLVANTFMSAVSYILLFLIQHTQNRESKALHLKVDELIRTKRQADNYLIGIEELTEDQLMELSARYRVIAERHHKDDCGRSA